MSNNEEITQNKVNSDGDSPWNDPYWVSAPLKKKSRKKPILICLGLFLFVGILAASCSSGSTSNTATNSPVTQQAPPVSPQPVAPVLTAGQQWVQGGGSDRVDAYLASALSATQGVSTAASNLDADGVITSGNDISTAASGILNEASSCDDPELSGILRDLGSVLNEVGQSAINAGNGFKNLDTATIESSTARISAATEKISPIQSRYAEWKANNS